MSAVYVDLVLDTGELIRVECPSKFEDEFFESLDHSMKIGECWSPARFDGCRAEFLGMAMDRVSMKRVVGMLR